MGGVEDRRRVLGDDLEAAGIVSLAATWRTARASTLAQERLGGGDREREVAALKAPGARSSMSGPGSDGARTMAAPCSAARALAASASTSALSPPVTSVEWSRSTASFSAAISTSVSPSHSVWSRPTEVSTVTREGITLVASSLPPSPASITPA